MSGQIINRDRVACPVCDGRGSWLHPIARRNTSGAVTETRMLRQSCRACSGTGTVSVPAGQVCGIEPGVTIGVSRHTILARLREEWSVSR